LMRSSTPKDLSIQDVDSLLDGFQRLEHLPAPSLPDRDEDLWRVAIDKAWKAEERQATKQALAVSAGTGSPRAVMVDLNRRKAIQAACEKQTGKPSAVGLSERFKSLSERLYRRLDPDYAKAEAKARRKSVEEVATIRQRLDLLLASVKQPLLQWSELAAGKGASQAWRTYQTAAHQSEPDVLAAVVQDLKRVKAKLQRAAKAGTLGADATSGSQESGTRAGKETATFAFYQDGDFWVLRFKGQGALLKHQKGLTYIRQMLMCPGQKQNAEKMAQLEGHSLIEVAARRAQGKDLYNTVTKATYRALDVISEKRALTPLWRHLRKHVYVRQLTYSPEKVIDWKCFPDK